MQVGIVGLPNSGKSTLFNALTKAGAEVNIYPFTTTSQNVGIAEVPDERLYKVVEIAHSQKIVPATIKFVDIAGLVRGASKGEGLGNQFLGYIRETDVIVHVVRCFENENITHIDGEIHPAFDIETIDLELALADFAIVEKRLERTRKASKSGEKKALREVEIYEKAYKTLSEGNPVRSLVLTEEEKEILTDSHLLTAKPLIFVANISEKDLSLQENPLLGQVLKKAEAENIETIIVSAKIEAEMAELEKEEAELFRKELKIPSTGLEKLINTSYNLLGLITFFTTESNECRAWTIVKGTKAPQAAGKIHTDMEKGFVKAEVVHYEDLVRAGSFKVAREQGHFL
ncbi:MAG: redox-regulated ATPase YchF, partial [Candidatus Subteraquimicrobiales bacterium]|nr:redox-regulated ATPase YchF [Candidatus Subteraquimicrobiales bacterium]